MKKGYYTVRLALPKDHEELSQLLKEKDLIKKESEEYLILRDQRLKKIVGVLKLAFSKKASSLPSGAAFNLSSMDPINGTIVEVSYGVFHPLHNNFVTFQLLWMEVVKFAKDMGARLILSFPFVSIGKGKYTETLLLHLKQHGFISPNYLIQPKYSFSLINDLENLRHLTLQEIRKSLPPFLECLVSNGGKVCGPPGIHPVYAEPSVPVITFT